MKVAKRQKQGAIMALFDIFDAVSEKQTAKTEFGEERIYGAVIGIVAENYAQEMPGRLCVTIPVRDTDANQLQWAKMAMPYLGAQWGTYFLPEQGDQVVLVFEDGNIEKPYVIGCIPKDKDRFLKKSATEYNQIKQIQTRNGSRITFWDDRDEAGAKDKITIATAQDMHHIDIDNEAKKIAFYDKEKNCLLEMGTEKGAIKAHAKSRMEITVGDSVKITLNGENGTVRIDAEKVVMAASKGIRLESDASLKLSGRQITSEASSLIKQSSNGMLSLEGKPVKLG